MRPVQSSPRIPRGQLALEEVIWVGVKAASQVQGQWSTPISAHNLQQTGALHKDRKHETESVSAAHKLGLLFIKCFQLSVHFTIIYNKVKKK